MVNMFCLSQVHLFDVLISSNWLFCFTWTKSTVFTLIRVHLQVAAWHTIALLINSVCVVSGWIDRGVSLQSEWKEFWIERTCQFNTLFHCHALITTCRPKSGLGGPEVDWCYRLLPLDNESRNILMIWISYYTILHMELLLWGVID